MKIKPVFINGMWEVDEGHFFTREEDAKAYADYLNHGLKIISATGRRYYFNDGAVMFDVTYPPNECGRQFVVQKDGKNLKSEKLIKKYVEVLKK